MKSTMRRTMKHLSGGSAEKICIKHVSRGRRLTAEEAQKYRALREKLEREMPAIIAEHRQRKK
jgi:hypothetical protein